MARPWLVALTVFTLTVGCEESPARTVGANLSPVALLELETPWPTATPESAGLSRPALEVLVRQSEESGSDARLVLARAPGVEARVA